MDMTDKLKSTLTGWVGVAIITVLGGVILLNFKDVGGVTSELNTSIDTYVTGLTEPANWIIIVIIALIGAYILYFFNKKGESGFGY